jgi:AP endonuclease-2
MNPLGMYEQGKRIREHVTTDILPLSGRLLPEFNRRQTIRDMFRRSSHVSSSEDLGPLNVKEHVTSSSTVIKPSSKTVPDIETKTVLVTGAPPDRERESKPETWSGGSSDTKRLIAEDSKKRPFKRTKLEPTPSPEVDRTRGQQRLNSFFKPKTPDKVLESHARLPIARTASSSTALRESDHVLQSKQENLNERRITSPSGAEINAEAPPNSEAVSSVIQPSPAALTHREVENSNYVHDPIVSKENWTKLFKQPVAPKCEEHGEPCISMLTKKSGMNCGRSFWMCSRPLGPSGAKEKGTQWRCPTFIWCSDWSSANS